MAPCKVCDDKGDFSDYNSSWMMMLKLSKLKEQKSKGCKTCALFFDGFSAFGQNLIKAKTAIWIQAEEDEKWRHVSFQVDGKTRYDEDSKLPCFDLDFFSAAPEGSPKLLPSIDTASRIPINPLSESCSRIIKSWIEECAKDHSFCFAPKSAHLPKRVIDVGSPDGMTDPRLYESQGEVGEYAALSYCWGRTPALTTTSATLASRVQGISWTQLPKTLQDAIKLARCLRLQYIWIDSLCIVQDDGKDWEEQASQMASIYEAAYITIAATQSAATTQGFLSNRDPDHELIHQI